MRVKHLVAAKIEVMDRRKEIKNKAPSTESALPRTATIKNGGNCGKVAGPCSSTHGQAYITHSLFVVVNGFSVFCLTLCLMHAMLLQHSLWYCYFVRMMDLNLTWDFCT